MLTNKNFLNNPTDALADGLFEIRKEAAAERTAADRKEGGGATSGAEKGKEESKENELQKDARQDLITVRE